jgi:hypothetical protein
MITNINGNIEYVNPKLKMTGHTFDRSLEKSPNSLVKRIRIMKFMAYLSNKNGGNFITENGELLGISSISPVFEKRKCNHI